MRRRGSPVVFVGRRATQRMTVGGRIIRMEMQLPLQFQMVQERMSLGC
jgi:hypothetical protein